MKMVMRLGSSATMKFVLAGLLCLLASSSVWAANGLPALTVQGTGQGQSYSLTLQLLVLMTAITFLPTIVV